MERVELACHTGFSRMKGIGAAKDYLEYAYGNGLKAIAITDIGCIDSFAEFESVKERFKWDVKIIYGVDLLVYDDNENEFRLSVLIKNVSGKKNLYHIISEGELHYKTEDEIRVPLNLLLENREGLLIGGSIVDDYLDYVTIEANFEDKTNVEKTINEASLRNIPAVAVSSSFYINESDSLAYKVLMQNPDAEERHIRSTEEMLKIFDFLGTDMAEEIAVTNSNTIADMCEEIKPCGTNKHYPYIENQNQLLRDICDEAVKRKGLSHSIKIKNRIKWELSAIEKSQSAFIFLQLKWVIDELKIKPFEITPRGMVGSSMVAYLCGITDINPIEARISPYFFFSLFGDRMPDIDLNFRTEIAEKVSELIGKAPGVGRAVRVGILCVLKEDFIIKMIKEYDGLIADEEIDLIVQKLKNTVKGRGRHPGGIFLLPENCNVDEICPLCSIGSGDDEVIVTAFDYHYSDFIFYKLDIFEHTSMDILYKLYEMTDADPCYINRGDEKTINLFKRFYNDIPECAGIPEFTSKFAFDVIRKTNPNNFDDLVKVLGLYHGTGTWTGNAEDILNEEDVKISGIPSNRSDIYDTLIYYGIDRTTAYLIAEDTRKGKIKRGKSKHWFDWKIMLLQNKIPVWFVWFCENVDYLFPRSHVYGYMTASWRIGWYKTHYPLQYYCVMLNECYSKEFNFVEMALGEDTLHEFINNIENGYLAEYEHINELKRTCYLLNDFYKYGFKFKEIERESSDEPRFEIMNDYTIGVRIF